MSFLLDPPILYAAGRAYGSTAPESAQGGKAVAAGAAATALLLGASVALWLDHPATKPLWKAFGAANGREYQAFTGLRSWPGAAKAGPREHALAAVGFAAYPLAWWLGWDRSRRARW
jgi:transcription elongation factor